VQGKEGLVIFSSRKALSFAVPKGYFWAKKKLSQYEIMRFQEIFKYQPVENSAVILWIFRFASGEILCRQGGIQKAAIQGMTKKMLYLSLLYI